MAIVCATSVYCRPAGEEEQSRQNLNGILASLLSLPVPPKTSVNLSNNSKPGNYETDYTPSYNQPAYRPNPAQNYEAEYVPSFQPKPTRPMDRPYPPPPANRPYPSQGKPIANRPYTEKPYAKPVPYYPESYNKPSYSYTTTKRPLPPIKIVLSLPGIPALEKPTTSKPNILCPPGQLAVPNILSPNTATNRENNMMRYGPEKEKEKEKDIKDFICILPAVPYDQYSYAPVYDSSYSKPPVTMAPYPSYNQPITSSNLINPTKTPSLPLNNQPYAPVSPPFNNILPTLPVKTN